MHELWCSSFSLKKVIIKAIFVVIVFGVSDVVSLLQEENKKLGAELNDAVDQNTEMHEKVLVVSMNLINVRANGRIRTPPPEIP